VRADGHVVSTRMPDRKGNSSAMLSNDQPLEAQADAMRTTERNQKVHYQGHAAAWQGSNRIWADVIDIDRASHTLAANGHVRTQLIEQQSQKETTATDGAAAKPQQPPTFVMIEAAALLYTESTRMAHYTGGVHLARPGMTVGASEIRAYLSEAGSDSSLDHAVADGHVEIVRRQPGRTLTGTGEHSEYYAKDERVFLSGGEPVLVDSVRGTTRGRELTYYAKDDKLLVNGVEKDPVTTRILRRH
jgi:lipopolysaccharide export system protein LptA